jgi:hypothetical protein
VSIEVRSILVWVGAFLALEIPAQDVLGLWPWYSLSQTVQVGVAWWWPLALYVTLFMFVLAGHFELNWRARYVVAVAFLGVCLILSHLIGRLADRLF